MWTTTSTPAGNATPSCAGKKCWRAGSFTRLMRLLAVRRRRISPTAMGRTPSLVFGTTTRPAPAMTAAASVQARPWARRLAAAASCSRKPTEAPGEQASRRCWARRPEGLGAVAAGKALKARPTTSRTISGATGNSCSPGRTGSGCVGWSSRTAMVSAVSGAKPVARRVAQAFPSKPSRTSAVAISRRSCWKEGTARSAARLGAGIPKLLTSAILPAAQPIQCICSCRPRMLLATSWGGIQHSLEQHKELPPGAGIIMVCHGSQCACEDAAPGSALQPARASGFECARAECPQTGAGMASCRVLEAFKRGRTHCHINSSRRR